MKIETLFWLIFVPFSSILFVLNFNPVSGQCLDDQKSLLLELRNNLNFDSSLSTKLVRWNQSADCCQWGGVNCDKAGHVIGVDLNNETIDGSVDNSFSLFGLRYLQILNLAHNNFNSSPLPSGFGKLTQLSYLNLSNANFEGQIPTEISLLTRLVTLDLSTSPYYMLNLENPDLKLLIQNLTELRELHLDNVNITAEGYSWSHAISSYLPNLQVLSLRSCSLSGPLDSSLAKLKYLSVTLLDDNNFSSAVPELFAELSNLTVLSLRACNLNGSVPKKIFQVPTLKTIDLSSNYQLEGSLPEFPRNGSLENLLLSNTLLYGKLPGTIGNLRMLSRIEIGGCRFSGPLPSSMQNLTQLVHFDLSVNNFTGSIPSFHLSKGLVFLNLYLNNLTGEIPSSHWEGLHNLEFLNLNSNFLSGTFPESLLRLPSLRHLDLSNNRFSGQISEIVNVSSYQLTNLDLSGNRFAGPIPSFIFKLPGLSTLSLTANNFTGRVELNTFGMLKNLYALELSYNDFSVDVSSNGSAFSSLSELNTLKLASCKMQELPDLKNQSKLMMIDLSDNKIGGEIPNWIWEVGNGYLRFLNLSHNKFSSLQKPYTFPFLLDVLDLHSNYLEGDIPIPPRRVYYLDYSSNDFGSSIPDEFGNVLTSTFFFSISSSKVAGVIPQSICNASNLNVLDLSNNNLNGSIPSCLAETSKTLRVLNLRGNNLSGNFLGAFPESCDLQTLDLSANHLQGPLPTSLVNCSNLEVLNAGYNMIRDTFPCWVTNMSKLHVLVLRSNSFHGEISCLGYKHNWTNLQIIDIASNSFSGALPPQSFSGLDAIMFDENEEQSGRNYLHFQSLSIRHIYYQDSVTVVFKGLSRELVKILRVFTSVDFSSNRFKGAIPVTVGNLKLLKVLNFSHNALTGPIPLSIGNLKELESLDLSVNMLNGNIPAQLATLTFLSVLNLSYNHLSGRIPQGSQFQTFSELSFEGNKGLCGLPLKKRCDHAPVDVASMSPPAVEDEDYRSSYYVSATLGFLVGFVIIVGPLVFHRKWRTWYNYHVDKILLRILYQQKPRTMKKARSL